MTWNESIDYCRNNGMELASIHSEEEWNKAKTAGATASCYGHCGPHNFSPCDWFWLGGRVDGTQVIWEDNTPFDWQPPFLEINSPLDKYLSGWPTVSCYGKGGGWHDAVGDWEMQALCKGYCQFCLLAHHMCYLTFLQTEHIF